ncbi:MAG: GNAT family N-acetyltransferase [Oscillospiraceae bacterium]|nr:GNAT family N-acetyltransferase [Oscillospiraceae bacterium]
MQIEDITFTLKDGRSALIRSPREDDAQAVLEALRKVSGETDFLTRYPEEWEGFTVEREKALFEQINRSDNETMLLCLVEGRLAGNCQISWSSKRKMKHRASVGIFLCREYWNLGIGTRLFQELIRIAEANPELLQIELEFIEGNSRARALYEKMGFRITAMRPNAFRLKDGSLHNEYTMIREIKDRIR